jgi:hypothetical protein
VHARVANRGPGISRGGQRTHQLERCLRVERILRGNSTPPYHSARGIARSLTLGRDRIHGGRISAGVSGARCVQPGGEFRGGACDVKAGEQLTTIQLDRLRVAMRFNRFVECERIAPDRTQVNRQLLGGTTDDDVRAERTA